MPAGLPQIQGMHSVQLLPRLQTQALYGTVIHAVGEGVLFQLLEVLHLPLLAADIALVFDGYFHLAPGTAREAPGAAGSKGRRSS